MGYVNRDGIAEKYGITFTLVRRKMKAEDEYYDEDRVKEIVAGYKAEGWKPGAKKCIECGKWLEKKAFHIMENRCKFCESKAIEARYGRG